MPFAFENNSAEGSSDKVEEGVSLFIPVYNAAKLIKRDLREAYNALQRLNHHFEIVVVDDNSTDKSYRFKKLLEEAKHALHKNLRYVSYSAGPSRRENLAKTFFQAKYDNLGFIDADFSCDISFFLKAVVLLKKTSADIVIGSRYIKGAKAKRRPLRRIFSHIYNGLVRLLFQSKIRDHQCGLKVFRRERVLPIIREMGYDEKFVRGWFWDAELLVRAQKANLKIIEMPVEWHYSDSSTFNFRREIKYLGAMVKLKRVLG